MLQRNRSSHWYSREQRSIEIKLICTSMPQLQYALLYLPIQFDSSPLIHNIIVAACLALHQDLKVDVSTVGAAVSQTVRSTVRQVFFGRRVMGKYVTKPQSISISPLEWQHKTSTVFFLPVKQDLSSLYLPPVCSTQVESGACLVASGLFLQTSAQ